MNYLVDIHTESIVRMIRSVPGEIMPGRADIDLVKENSRIKIIGKREKLVIKGQVCKSLFFVLKGGLHSFYTTDKGEEFTRCVALENSFCWSVPSFLRQTPSTENIESLAESELLVIDHAAFQKLCQELPWFRSGYQAVLENLCISYAERVESLLTMNAGERYRNLLQENPQIIQELPNKKVASFLGITQESLSRIKAAR